MVKSVVSNLYSVYVCPSKLKKSDYIEVVIYGLHMDT